MSAPEKNIWKSAGILSDDVDTEVQHIQSDDGLTVELSEDPGRQNALPDAHNHTNLIECLDSSSNTLPEDIHNERIEAVRSTQGSGTAARNYQHLEGSLVDCGTTEPLCMDNDITQFPCEDSDVTQLPWADSDITQSLCQDPDITQPLWTDDVTQPPCEDPDISQPPWMDADVTQPSCADCDVTRPPCGEPDVTQPPWPDDDVAQRSCRPGDVTQASWRDGPWSDPSSLDRLTAVTLTGTSGSPSGPDLASDASGADVLERAELPECDRRTSRLAAQERMQRAVEKVEQLDRSIEKTFKEHLDARSVTADLQALVRRELAQLSCPGGRQQSREETDNTMRFLSVLLETDGAGSDTSSQVTPIFQTQVRFGGQRLPAPADGCAADSCAADSASSRQSCGDSAAESGADSSQQPSASTCQLPPRTAGGEILADGDPTDHRPAAGDFFIRRNIKLAQELGGSLAMTEEERQRVEQLLADEDELENAFSVDEHARQLLLSVDDQLSSMGAGSSWMPASSPPASETTAAGRAGGDSGATGEDAEDAELDYLQEIRDDREMAARMEVVQRKLDLLKAPLEVRPLERSDVDSVIHDTIAAFVSMPRPDLKSTTSKTSGLVAPSSSGLLADSSLVTAPTDATSEASSSTLSQPTTPPLTAFEDESVCSSGRTQISELSSAEPAVSCPSPAGPPSETRSDTTVDLRSLLSGRHADNERQLALELRPGSPSAWLVDVDQGPQRLQLVVPRLCRKLISDLLGAVGHAVLPESQPPVSASGDGVGCEEPEPSAA